MVSEKIDTDHLLGVRRTYRCIGFTTAIGDFGAGHAGLQLLSKVQPDIVKLDMDLVRGIDVDGVKRSIMRHTLGLLEEFGITALCDGVETTAELAVLRDLGIRLVQGYLIAKPAFESLAVPDLSPLDRPQAPA